MPLIKAYISDPDLVQTVRDNEAGIRAIVAAVHSCFVPNPIGDAGTFIQLDPDEDTEFYPFDVSGPGNHSNAGVVLDIEAMDYPDRAANLPERGLEIDRRVKELLATDRKVASWTKLGPYVWTETK